MYQRVIDIATGREEMIDFIPVNTYATASRIPDALFAHMHDYVDHTRASYPEQEWTPPLLIMSKCSQILIWLLTCLSNQKIFLTVLKNPVRLAICFCQSSVMAVLLVT